jgi:hypothetical protein
MAQRQADNADNASLSYITGTEHFTGGGVLGVVNKTNRHAYSFKTRVFMDKRVSMKHVDYRAM